MIEEKEYKRRRERVANSLHKNSIAVLHSALPSIRSNDTEYLYRQNSNFYYLTGFREDNAVLLLMRGKTDIASYLFVQKREKRLELWTGKRLGVKDAQKKFRHDNVFISQEFEDRFNELSKVYQHLYYDFGLDEKRASFLRTKTKTYTSYRNIAPLIEKERLIKSPSEIKLIQKALVITQKAHHYAMSYAKELKLERVLQAEIECIFKKNGAYSDAYTSIVACANSANTLHYISNNKELVNNELLLIDAGCEYEYYASDITRTIPVNGKFTPTQKELYNMVLDVEKKIINMVRPGTFRSLLQKRSEELLCKGLIDLGILKGDLKKLLKKKKHKKYYPHGIGHWMGIDVHDPCPYKDEKGKEIPFTAGMVMTIEPGIYIDKEDRSVPKRFRGIGIRIEDNILVTKSSYKNLSQEIVKEVDEIESFSS